MPTYEYRCTINDIEFEEFHSIVTQLEECPICKEKNLEQHKPKRLISGGSGKGNVILTGHDLIEKTKSDTAKLKQEIKTNEKLHANIVGEQRFQEIQTNMDKSKR